MFYLWGYSSAFVVYCLLCHFFPAKETIIPATIYDDSDVVSGQSVEEDGESDGPEKEKKAMDVESSPV